MAALAGGLDGGGENIGPIDRRNRDYIESDTVHSLGGPNGLLDFL